MIIDCISDLHGHYPKLEGGDLLIVAGDLTSDDRIPSWKAYYDWLQDQDYKKIVYIAGNHDNFLTHALSSHEADKLELDRGDPKMEYLCDSGTEFGGLRIWGSPWTKRLPGMNPNCMAFTVDTDEELAEKWARIPEDVDILVTHCPPFAIMDEVQSYYDKQIEYVGSYSLLKKIEKIQPRLMVFGHIHECYGKMTAENLQIIKNLCPNTIFVNASHVNERYEPVNKPLRIIL